jgi:Transposase DDE domain
LVLDVVIASGRQHSSKYAGEGLGEILDSLSSQQQPALVRGDCGFGNEPFIGALEDRNQAYLFKLRQSKGVQRLLARQFARQDWSKPKPADQGWSAVEDKRDNTVQFQNLVLQIEKVNWRGTLSGCTVTVHQHLDGTLSITYGPQRLGSYTSQGVPVEKTSAAAKAVE